MTEQRVERRAHRRVKAGFELQGLAQGDVVARMTASDLSLGGICCVSGVDFPEMTRLGVRLMLPLDDSGEPVAVEAEAVVVRREVRPSAAGNDDARYKLSLFFTRLDAASKQNIATFIAR